MKIFKLPTSRMGIVVERARLDKGEFPLHGHDFHELVVVTGGVALQSDGYQAGPVAAGDVFCFKGGQTHGFAKMDELELVNVMFDPEIVERMAAEVKAMPGFAALFAVEPNLREHGVASQLRLDAGRLRQVVDILDRIRAELAAAMPGSVAMANALFTEIAILLAREQRRRTPGGCPNAMDGLANAIAHIEGRFRQELSLEELAGKAGMSVNNFLRNFGKIKGMSPMAYVDKLRMDLAKSMLLTPNRPAIGEVAAACGFPDANYFARKFRQRFGMPPSRYQK